MTEEMKMKSELLKEQGLTDEQIKFVMAENGKDIEKAKGDLSTLTAERDKYKAQAETAEESLKKFEEIDVDSVKAELADWKKKAEDQQKAYTEELYKRDFKDALTKELTNVKFSSEAAKRSIMSEIEGAGLKLNEGKILGLSDLLGQMREKDASAFVNDAEASKPHFTTPMEPQGNTGTTLTKADILKIKDSSERQRAIAQNINLFKGE